jgi:hypothetical protein
MKKLFMTITAIFGFIVAFAADDAVTRIVEQSFRTNTPTQSIFSGVKLRIAIYLPFGF